MAAGVKSRVKLPQVAAAGEVITIKTLITHRMESGQRRHEAGAVIPRSIIHRFVCAFEGETVVDIEVHPGVSTNPFFEFRARVIESGVFRFTWYDDDGAVYTDSKAITVT
ncbi:thiosulfate oxidation carrier complex protein SoxZ [Roseobacter sinensis]|uniref:Thiosulfate oxidation carrier complex protein SoxZ n=1 Tax=Roseobacter sinensis TaxID=2931391 RepID=A0ABT3BKF3_9RHOB|nr:thiosulfate oxidation carrier complex protein SoxZ [Roseobacter sp. WL0113]MCV3274050.1 thiosulfate oxidation carrier complex protein SoxZ [Roseobacter sp. WL0113]